MKMLKDQKDLINVESDAESEECLDEVYEEDSAEESDESAEESEENNEKYTVVDTKLNKRSSTSFECCKNCEFERESFNRAETVTQKNKTSVEKIKQKNYSQEVVLDSRSENSTQINYENQKCQQNNNCVDKTKMKSSSEDTQNENEDLRNQIREMVKHMNNISLENSKLKADLEQKLKNEKKKVTFDLNDEIVTIPSNRECFDTTSGSISISDLDDVNNKIDKLINECRINHFKRNEECINKPCHSARSGPADIRRNVGNMSGGQLKSFGNLYSQVNSSKNQNNYKKPLKCTCGSCSTKIYSKKKSSNKRSSRTSSTHKKTYSNSKHKNGNSSKNTKRR